MTAVAAGGAVEWGDSLLEPAMTFTGRVIDGRVVPDAPIPLPDGTPVWVDVASEPVEPAADTPTVVGRRADPTDEVENPRVQ